MRAALPNVVRGEKEKGGLSAAVFLLVYHIRLFNQSAQTHPPPPSLSLPLSLVCTYWGTVCNSTIFSTKYCLPFFTQATNISFFCIVPYFCLILRSFPSLRTPAAGKRNRRNGGR